LIAVEDFGSDVDPDPREHHWNNIRNRVLENNFLSPTRERRLLVIQRPIISGSKCRQLKALASFFYDLI